MGLANLVKANELPGRDLKIFEQASMAMSQHSWAQAEKLLSQLHAQWPSNYSVTNNLAVTFFNLGRLDEAQELFSQVISSTEHTRTAFQNLQTLYGYSAAKAYSKGLNLLKPIELPNMLVSQYNSQKTATKLAAKMPETVQQPSGLMSDDLGEKSTLKIIESLTTEEKTDNNKNLLTENNAAGLDKINNPITKIQAEPKKQAEIKVPMPVKKPSQVETKVQKKQPQPDDKIVLLAQLTAWAKAWSDGNVEAYVDFYGATYAPRGKSRKAWLKNRQRRVIPSKKIEINLTAQQVYIHKNKKQANTLFTQTYRSKNYSDKVKKRITWVKKNGTWLIAKEVIIQSL